MTGLFCCTIQGTQLLQIAILLVTKLDDTQTSPFGSTGTANDCDNSIEFTAPGCGSYNLVSDGMADVKQCEPFNITVNVCVQFGPQCIKDFGAFQIIKNE